MAKEKTEAAKAQTGRPAEIPPKVKWVDTNMKTNYSNAFNVFSDKQEMTFLFGTNQTLYTGQEEVTVDLSNRIVLNPVRAKAFSIMLNSVLSEYEKIYGDIT
jgi:hypothetical protein